MGRSDQKRRFSFHLKCVTLSVSSSHAQKEEIFFRFEVCNVVSLLPPFCHSPFHHKFNVLFEKKKTKKKGRRPSVPRMQSPPQEKGTRPVSSWTKDYHTTVPEMKTQSLLTITLTGDTRVNTVTNKTCLFCDWTYYYRFFSHTLYVMTGRTITDSFHTHCMS